MNLYILLLWSEIATYMWQYWPCCCCAVSNVHLGWSWSLTVWFLCKKYVLYQKIHFCCFVVADSCCLHVKESKKLKMRRQTVIFCFLQKSNLWTEWEQRLVLEKNTLRGKSPAGQHDSLSYKKHAVYKHDSAPSATQKRAIVPATGQKRWLQPAPAVRPWQSRPQPHGP